MPTSAVSPVVRIHSWSFVYFRSAGYIAGSAPRPLVERHGDDTGGGEPAAHFDVNLAVGFGHGRRHIRHADGLLQERRLRAAGDGTGGVTIDHDRIPVAG